MEDAFRNYSFELRVLGYELGKAEVGGQGKRLPVAKKLGGTSLMFLVHPTLSQENMHYVV